MGIRLFVGNLSYNATEDEIRGLFEQYGTVRDCHIVMDRETNRSKGFCFVEMGTKEEAASAIEKLNGSEFDGRKMNVSEARPRAERPAGGYQGGREGGHREDKGDRHQGAERTERW